MRRIRERRLVHANTRNGQNLQKCQTEQEEATGKKKRDTYALSDEIRGTLIIICQQHVSDFAVGREHERKSKNKRHSRTEPKNMGDFSPVLSTYQTNRFRFRTYSS